MAVTIFLNLANLSTLHHRDPGSQLAAIFFACHTYARGRL